jgi:hypothetical protein
MTVNETEPQTLNKNRHISMTKENQVGHSMSGNATNKYLHQAKMAKYDEFYTQLSDIEKELRHYKGHFKDKVVFCNCDDPRVSNFFHYFSYNFEKLGLKKLITTCYKNINLDSFSQHDKERAIYLEYEGDKNNNNVPNLEEIGIKHLKGDGDFRSKECIELLKRADIVVTNPPFSLFREYVAQLIEYDKKFVIIGNKNAITYKEIFKLIKENKLCVGNTSMSTDLLFDVTDDYAKELIANKKEGSGYKIINGVVKGRAQAIWFTNLDISKRHEHLILYKKYNPTDYLKYENYDAINVNKTREIPMNYEGAMGVPISFLDVFNPEQFVIIGMCENEDIYKLKTKVYTTTECKQAYLRKFGKKGTYDLNASGVVYHDGLLVKVYQRVLIKKKKPDGG